MEKIKPLLVSKNRNVAQEHFYDFPLMKYAEILGKDFVPYAKAVVPGAISRALEPLEVREHADEASTWEKFTLQGKHLEIDQEQIKEKFTSCVALQVYMDALGEQFAPFADDTITACVRNLCFAFHKGIQLVSAMMLPGLVACKRNEEGACNGSFEYIISGLFQVIKQEHDDKMIYQFTKRLSLCLEAGRMFTLPDEVTEQLIKFFFDKFKRWTKYVSLLEEADGELSAQGKANYKLFSSFCDAYLKVIATLAKVQPNGFNVISKNMITQIMPVLIEDEYQVIRAKVVRFFSDLIEHCGRKTSPLIPQVVNPCLSFCSNETGELRCAAAHTLGVLATASPSRVASLISNITEALESIIKDGPRTQTGSENGEMDENPEVDTRAETYDEALLSYGKILLNFPLSSENCTEKQLLFCNQMPLTHNEKVAILVHSIFVDLLQKEPSLIEELGAKNTKKIIASFVETPFSNDNIDKKAKALLSQLE